MKFIAQQDPYIAEADIRTRTGDSDRGKGLLDLMEFIRQRGEGYLSIISLKGLFKLEIKLPIPKHKTDFCEH